MNTQTGTVNVVAHNPYALPITMGSAAYLYGYDPLWWAALGVVAFAVLAATVAAAVAFGDVVHQ